MSEKTVSGWDDLKEVEQTETRVFRLPKTSEAAGRDISVKVRGITPLEMVAAYNFPIDEINAMLEERADAEKYTAALVEHTSTFGVADVQRTMRAAIKLGLVEPDPNHGDIDKLKRDFSLIFSEIVALTMPEASTKEAATFPDSGERSSD